MTFQQPCDFIKTMKSFLKILALSFVLTCSCFAEQKVIVIQCDSGDSPDISRVESLIQNGWTIQTVTSSAGHYGKQMYFVFILHKDGS